MDIYSPSILRRYMSTFIDGVFILTTFLAVSAVLELSQVVPDTIRVPLILGILFLYEPICTSLLCTVGQKLTGIRVRKLDGKTKISLFAAVLRYLVKVVFGLFSLLSIPFSKNRKALHDFASGSVVVLREGE